MPTTLCKNVRLAFASAIIISYATFTWTVSGQDEPPGPPRQNKKENKPPRKDGRKEGAPQQYTIEQAISDQAQLHTIAFSGLAFITGDFGASTFIPPGKVCDFFGFQYMRDIDAAQKGHNPMFLNRVAGNVLYILNEEQKKLFLSMAEEQAVKLEELARLRLPLIKAFCRELDGNIPQGSTGLNKEAVTQYVGKIFAFDADLSCRRAEMFGKVAASLTAAQKKYLGKMKFGDFNSWPALDERDRLKEKGKGKSKLFNVAYMTYASEFFSWYAGSIEADTYFCPERHGTYFGGFYMKDMPAMGKRDFSISTSVTGDSGKMFLETLNDTQRENITGIIDSQRKALLETIAVRKQISFELRKYLKGEIPEKAKIIELGHRYGELDGEMSWYYATAFAKVKRALTPEQNAILMKLRNLDGYKSATYYIYSQAIKDKLSLPDTDSFFFEPQSGNKQ